MKEQFVILNLIFKCQLKLNQVKMRKEMDIFMRRSKTIRGHLVTSSTKISTWNLQGNFANIYRSVF
jgi:hypothetical protein